MFKTNQPFLLTTPRIPLAFKLWFAFVLALVLSTIGATLYGLYVLIQLGPEGLAAILGRSVAAFNSAVQQ